MLRPSFILSRTGVNCIKMAESLRAIETTRPLTLFIDDSVRRAEAGRDTVEGIANDELQNAAKTNRYAARKSFVISTFDVSLFVANMSQLVTVVDLGGVRDGMYLPYYEATVGLLVTSLVLQVIFAIMMIWIWIIERRKEQKCPNHGQAVNNGPPTTPPTPTPGGCCGNGLRSKCCRSEWAERLDEIGLVIVFLTIILNIVITSLGLTGNVPNELSQSQTRVT